MEQGVGARDLPELIEHCLLERGIGAILCLCSTYHPSSGGNPALKGRVFSKKTTWEGLEAPPKTRQQSPALRPRFTLAQYSEQTIS